MIDYIGLIKPEGFNADYEKMAELTKDLRDLAMKHKISIITADSNWVQIDRGESTPFDPDEFDDQITLKFIKNRVDEAADNVYYIPKLNRITQ